MEWSGEGAAEFLVAGAPGPCQCRDVESHAWVGTGFQLDHSVSIHACDTAGDKRAAWAGLFPGGQSGRPHQPCPPEGLLPPPRQLLLTPALQPLTLVQHPFLVQRKLLRPRGWVPRRVLSLHTHDAGSCPASRKHSRGLFAVAPWVPQSTWWS